MPLICVLFSCTLSSNPECDASLSANNCTILSLLPALLSVYSSRFLRQAFVLNPYRRRTADVDGLQTSTSKRRLSFEDGVVLTHHMLYSPFTPSIETIPSIILPASHLPFFPFFIIHIRTHLESIMQSSFRYIFCNRTRSS